MDASGLRSAATAAAKRAEAARVARAEQAARLAKLVPQLEEQLERQRSDGAGLHATLESLVAESEKLLELRREAHSMKGAAATMGADALSEAALELQLACEARARSSLRGARVRASARPARPHGGRGSQGSAPDGSVDPSERKEAPAARGIDPGGRWRRALLARRRPCLRAARTIVRS